MFCSDLPPNFAVRATLGPEKMGKYYSGAELFEAHVSPRIRAGVDSVRMIGEVWLTQASKLPGETMRPSRTAWILLTRFVIAVCSVWEGVRSVFLFINAWNAEEKFYSELCDKKDFTGWWQVVCKQAFVGIGFAVPLPARLRLGCRKYGIIGKAGVQRGGTLYLNSTKVL